VILRIFSVVLVTFLMFSCSSSSGAKKSRATMPGVEGGDGSGEVEQGPTYRPRLVTSHSEETGSSDSQSGEGTSPGSGDDMEVSGLGGTIDEAAVAKAFDRKKYEIEQCVLGKARAMTYLEGTLNFRFTVFPNGRIELDVLDDDLGNFQVEACLERVVRSIRLGRPKGGKVQISYPLRIPNRGTDHVSWSASRLRRVLRPLRRKLRACRRGGRRKVTLHMYILPGGRLISLGAFSDRGLEIDVARCAFDVLGEVQFPDPLGKVVKARYSF